jgi:hypothetical protein
MGQELQTINDLKGKCLKPLSKINFSLSSEIYVTQKLDLWKLSEIREC